MNPLSLLAVFFIFLYNYYEYVEVSRKINDNDQFIAEGDEAGKSLSQHPCCVFPTSEFSLTVLTAQPQFSLPAPRVPLSIRGERVPHPGEFFLLSPTDPSQFSETNSFQLLNI